MDDDSVDVRGTTRLSEASNDIERDLDLAELRVGERTGAGVSVMATVLDTVDRVNVSSSLIEFRDGTIDDEFLRIVFVW